MKVQLAPVFLVGNRLVELSNDTANPIASMQITGEAAQAAAQPAENA